MLTFKTWGPQKQNTNLEEGYSSAGRADGRAGY